MTEMSVSAYLVAAHESLTIIFVCVKSLRKNAREKGSVTYWFFKRNAEEYQVNTKRHPYNLPQASHVNTNRKLSSPTRPIFSRYRRSFQKSFPAANNVPQQTHHHHHRAPYQHQSSSYSAKSPIHQPHISSKNPYIHKRHMPQHTWV